MGSGPQAGAPAIAGNIDQPKISSRGAVTTPMAATEPVGTGEGFKKYFDILPGLTDSEKQAAFRIRHSVYCEDLGWEPIHPEGVETDSYDSQSLHCLIRSRASGDFIGCVRLIRAAHGAPAALLPFEHTCADTMDRSIVDPAQLPRTKIAEVSRLAISRQFRRRRGEERTPGTVQDADFGTADGPRFPYLLVGLYMGVFAIAERHGLEKLFMLCEPRLARHLNRIGITNEQIGEATEHRKREHERVACASRARARSPVPDRRRVHVPD